MVRYMEFVKEYYLTGTLKQETPYLHGQINGIEKYFYEDGILARETPFLYGQIHGIEKCYDEDGKRQAPTHLS